MEYALEKLIYQLLPCTFDYFQLKGYLNVRILKDPRYSVGQNAEETDSINTTTIDQFKVPPQILFAHPEDLIENKKVFTEVLRTKVYRERVKAIVIDEAHLVVEW